MDIGDMDHRRDVAHRIKGVVLHQMRIGGMGADDEAEGMAISIGPHNGFRADQPRRAGAVFDNDILAERFLQGRRNHAREDIGSPGRWPGHDEADGTCGHPGALRAQNTRRGKQYAASGDE